MILELKGVDTFYGTSHVLQGVSLRVDGGETVALLGRNGVGKTTALRSIMGLTPPRAGSLRFRGAELRGLPPDAVARAGIAFVPDDHRVFPRLTVDENLEVAARLSRRSGPWDAERVRALFPGLRDLGRNPGSSLSGGERKMVAIGRALMANPALLLLDEPSEGLAPMVVANLVEVLARIRREGTTLLLADQNLRFCLRVCDRGYVLEKGRVAHQGPMDEISRDEAVVGRYLAV